MECCLVDDGELVGSHGQAAPPLESVDAPFDGVALLVSLERIRESRANGWLGEVEGLQVSFDAAMAKLNSLKRSPTDGRPRLIDLGMPVFTDHAPRPRQDRAGPDDRP